MVNVVICGAAALLPSIFLLRYFIKSDKYPEPTDVLVKTFLLGIVVTIPIIVVELFMQGAVKSVGGPATQAILTSFLVAGLCEEAFKFLVLHKYCARHSAFDEPMDAVVYGVVVSLGFATIENVLYVAQGGLGVAVARAVTAVPAHACFGALMGYYYAKAHFGETGKRDYTPALLVPIIIHGLYDAPLFLLGVKWILANSILALALLIGFIVLLRWMYTRIRSIVTEMRAAQDDLAPPAPSVPEPTPPPSET